MRIEHAAGNHSGLHSSQQVNHTLDCSLETETFQLINELLNNSTPEAREAL
ncbi:hypothetical protein [Streptomyces chartreusis]|uniref:hypothetical protein n=1 Tax=Streptomyces chartreusis TaxID=1969 RepID=UPI00380AEFCE